MQLAIIWFGVNQPKLFENVSQCGKTHAVMGCGSWALLLPASISNWFIRRRWARRWRHSSMCSLQPNRSNLKMFSRVIKTLFCFCLPYLAAYIVSTISEIRRLGSWVIDVHHQEGSFSVFKIFFCPQVCRQTSFTKSVCRELKKVENHCSRSGVSNSNQYEGRILTKMELAGRKRG